MESSTATQNLTSIKKPLFMTVPELALANSLYHEKRLNDAREILVARLKDTSCADEQLTAAYMLAKVEVAASNLYEAANVLHNHAALADACADHLLLAHFHETRGGIFQLIGEREHFDVNADRALLEYAAASYHYEQAGDRDVAGCAENNIGLLLAQLGKSIEAREHLERARKLFSGSVVKLAEVDHTEAEIYLLEGNYFDALRLASKAMSVFTACDELRLIAVCWPTLHKAGAYHHRASLRDRDGEVEFDALYG